VNWLLDQGCHVVFMGRQDPQPALTECYRYLPFPDARGARYYTTLLGRRVGRWLADLEVLLRLRLAWHRLRPDIVHVHWVDQQAYRCGRARLHPLVLSVWGSDVNEALLTDPTSYRRRVTGRALANADLVIVDSPEMPDKCCRLAGKSIRTEILPLGIDTTAFRPGHLAAAKEWRRRLAIAPEATVLLSVRALGPKYGHHLILDAFAEARPRCRQTCFLLFVLYNRESYPDAHAYEAQLRDRANRLGVAAFVRWLDPLPHERLPELYATSDIVVNYPSMDAFPVTFLEAAACERPVISVRLPAYQGTFAEKYFRLVEPDRVSDLSNAIVDLANEPPGPSVSNLAEARALVVGAYDQVLTARRLLQLYRALA
jgi:glycosyltransferase involved in cell wall biosynthesis